MTQQQALKLLRAKYGKEAAIRDKGVRSGPDLRAYHSAQRAALGERPAAPDVWKTPDDMTMAEYRQLLREHRQKADDYKKAHDHHMFGAMRYRYEVGTLTHMRGLGNAFHIRGSGDTWDAALDAAGVTLPEKQARPVPTCKKCNAEHWPFQACA